NLAMCGDPFRSVSEQPGWLAEVFPRPLGVPNGDLVGVIPVRVAVRDDAGGRLRAAVGADGAGGQGGAPPARQRLHSARFLYFTGELTGSGRQVPPQTPGAAVVSANSPHSLV